jgi:hypothetical protein
MVEAAGVEIARPYENYFGVVRAREGMPRQRGRIFTAQLFVALGTSAAARTKARIPCPVLSRPKKGAGGMHSEPACLQCDGFTPENF